MEDNYRNISQSIQRVIDVLFAFTLENPELGITELSEFLNLPKSTVHRLVVNLEVRGLVEQDSVTGKYRLGIKTMELGMRTWLRLDLVSALHPFLKDLAARTGESAVLAVLSDGEVVYLDKVDSHREVRAISAVGQRRPVHCTALGKVFLSALPEHEVAQILSRKPLTPRTPKTITDPERLLREIATVRAQGYAIDNEEFDVDLCCLAAPIRNGAGAVIAAIGIAGPTSRMNPTTLDSLVEVLTSTANTASEQFQYVGHVTTPVVE